MKRKILRMASVMLVILFLCSSVYTLALNFNGTSPNSGDGSSTTASTGGYAVPSMLTSNSNRAVGYRFSVCDVDGDVVYSPIDLFRHKTYEDDKVFYAGYSKFDEKMAKTELICVYSSHSFSTSTTTAAVAHDSNINLTFPNDTKGLEAWCTDANIGVVLKGVWGTSVSTLEENGWAILVEPIFPVKIQGVYHSLTPTEIAVYGAAKFGAGSNGNSSSNSNSWGFIANYTNRHLPNSLRLKTSYMGMSAVSSASSNLTFSNIINNGYGAAIVYGENLEAKPSIIRDTYYMPDYDGFYVYVYTENASSLKIPTWTSAGGQDDLIWYNAKKQNNYVDGYLYNWYYYVPISEHKNELSVYNTHFYAYASNGSSVSDGDTYEPPRVTATQISDDGNGLDIYIKTAATTGLSVPVWTSSKGQDDLKWYSAKKQNNTISGVTYNWYVYIPFSDHNNEYGVYNIHYYVWNYYSEQINSWCDTYYRDEEIIEDPTPDILPYSCTVYKGKENNHDCKLGISYDNYDGSYSVVNGYPQMGNVLNFTVRFNTEYETYPVRQTVWIGNDSLSRKTNSDDSYYDCYFDNLSIDKSMQYILVKASVDIYSDYSYSSIIRECDTLTFYIPVKPIVIANSVTAIDILGNDYTVSTEDTKGTVYYGQRITNKYSFKQINNWTSKQNFKAVPLIWKDGQKTVGSTLYNGKDYDLSESNISISESSPHIATGSINHYVVDKNSTYEENGVMKYLLASSWVNHNSTVETEISANVITSDVEMSGISLVDENGYVIEPEKIEEGQKVTVYYYCKNNTACDVFVNVYGTAEKKIGDIYRINANEKICVKGETITINDINSLSIWGGVYLEGVNICDTHFESNGNNNEMTLNCSFANPMDIVPIEPNEKYRENTTVISSFWIINDGPNPCLPSSKACVDFEIFIGKEKIKMTSLSNIVVPANDYNLYFIKWKIPDGSKGEIARITASLKGAGGEISYKELTNEIIEYTDYRTPDTKYEKKAPDDFTLKEKPKAKTGYATWWQYEYDSNADKFVKKEYGCGINSSIKDELFAQTDPNYKGLIKDKKIKSGYGFTLKANNKYSAVIGYLIPNDSAFVNTQYAVALFPEFAYFKGKNKCCSLSINEELSFINEKYNNMHFIPIYYPDGDYTVAIERSDFWTPAGMIKSVSHTDSLTVDGNAYSDWYIGRKN